MNSFSTNYPRVKADGTQNFNGYFIEFFFEFKSDCNLKTQNTYISRYNKDVLPILNPNTDITDLNEDVINRYLSIIQENTNCPDSSLKKNFAHLFTDAVNHYYTHRGQESINPLWGTAVNFYGSKDYENAREIYASIPKSFSISNNINVFHYLCSDPNTTYGERIGLAIMFFITCRENEVAGMTFSSIKHIGDNAFAHYIEVGLNSTKINSRDVKGGTKTPNGPRLVPIPEFLFEFLMKRKEFVKQETHLDNVDKLPIVCKGKNYGMRCSSNEISKEGKIMIKNVVKMDDKDYSALSAMLLEQNDDEFDIVEKSPTAYILRRNAATFCKSLLSETECLYVIGHDMIDTPLDRKFYGSEEFLFEIWKKMQQHPLNNIDKNRRYVDMASYLTNTIQANIKLTGNKPFIVQIKTNEQFDNAHINIDGCKKCTIIESSDLEEFDETINITKNLKKAYNTK